MEFELFPKLSFHFEVFFTIVTGAGAGTGAEIIGVLGDVWVGVVAISFATLVSISLASVIDIDKEEETAGAVERLDPFELEVTEDIAKLTGNIAPGVGPPAAASTAASGFDPSAFVVFKLEDDEAGDASLVRDFDFELDPDKNARMGLIDGV